MDSLHQKGMILLVDDDEDDFRITRAMLQEAYAGRVALEWVSSYREAEILLRANRYDAVLVDYDLGAQTGVDFIREMVGRAYPAPFILYTGRGSHQMDLEAMQAGATLYLTKDEASPLLLERFLRYAIERKRIDLELDQRLRERDEILASIQDGFFAIDRNWCFRYVNRRAAENIYMEANDLVGKNLWETFPFLVGTETETHYHRAMEEGISVQYEVKGVLRPLWYNVSVYPSPEGITIYWQDITRQKQDQDALAERDEVARQRLMEIESLYQSAPVGLCVIDRELRWVRINQRMADMNGYAVEDHIGRRIRELTPWLADLVEGPLEQVIETGQPVLDFEFVVGDSTQTGLLNTYIQNWVPIQDANQQVIGVSIMVEDVSRRRQIEQALAESEENYRILFDSMLNGFALHEIICDEAGVPVDYRFLKVNPAFERLTGISGAMVVGKTILEIMPETEPFWFERYGKVALQATQEHFENYSGVLKKYYEVFAFSPRPGQFATLFVDITERKQAEIELHTYAAELERSNQALEEFAMVASHDMREPLRKVITFGELLKNDQSSSLSQKGLDFLERVQQAASRMQTMLEGLLEYARLASHGHPFEKVDLNRVAAGVLADLEVRIANSGGVVVVDSLGEIEADPLQMRRLLQNLISNALKFHPPDRPPRVQVSLRPAGPGAVDLWVEDNGIGFDPQDAERLFTPFLRLRSRAQYEGTGMGLAICRRIVERHGGSISAAGRMGEGAIFTVRLPVKQRE